MKKEKQPIPKFSWYRLKYVLITTICKIATGVAILGIILCCNGVPALIYGLAFIGMSILMYVSTYLTTSDEDLESTTAYRTNKDPKHKNYKNQPIITSSIKTIKVLGIRTGIESGILVDYNTSLYSLQIIYENGSQEIVECDSTSIDFQKYAPYINKDDLHNDEQLDVLDDD